MLADADITDVFFVVSYDINLSKCGWSTCASQAVLSSESRNGLADRCIHPAAAVAGPKCRQRRYKGGPSNEIH